MSNISLVLIRGHSNTWRGKQSTAASTSRGQWGVSKNNLRNFTWPPKLKRQSWSESCSPVPPRNPDSAWWWSPKVARAGAAIFGIIHIWSGRFGNDCTLHRLGDANGRSILVMDEATRALGNETEKEIVAEIQRLNRLSGQQMVSLNS